MLNFDEKPSKFARSVRPVGLKNLGSVV